jgi:hypothetical protein
MSDDTPVDEPKLDEPELFLKPIPVLEEKPAAPDRFYVLGTDLVCQTEEGELELSLKIKTKLQVELEDKTPREQLYIVLRSQGRDEQVELIEELDLIDSREIVRKYWQAFGERNEARLGESLSSSPS